MHLFGPFFAMIVGVLYVALLVFVIVMILRLVKAVERIADSLESKG